MTQPDARLAYHQAHSEPVMDAMEDWCHTQLDEHIAEFMSLIHTCQLNGDKSLDYLQTLSKHSGKLAAAPEPWLPWNYGDTAAALELARV